MRPLNIGLLAAAALVVGAGGSLAQTRTITVDAAHPTGRLKPLRGVNGAPDVSFATPEQLGARPRPTDVSAGYRAARVTLVRTHDSYGAADIDAHAGPLPSLMLPTGQPAPKGAELDLNSLFPDLTADPADPKSYNWGPTDRLVASIRALDADVIFRMGREGMTTALPPTDLAKYAEVIRHVVLHYNKGWAGGGQDQVRYWEVWNEPDLGTIWWRGTPEQYYALYGAAAKAVKAADPKALIGGPTIALVNEATPYREGFLAYARDNRLPLDYFAWHWYSTDADDPYDFARIGVEMRGLLDRYGFQKTLSVLDEWNWNTRAMRGVEPTVIASFVTSSRIYMQDAPIDLDAFYRADHEFGPDGKTPTKIGQALLAQGRLADTPVRLGVKGGDHDGLAVAAGRSEDGRTVTVLISNYEIPEDVRGPRKGPDVLHEGPLFDLRLPPRRSVTYKDNRGYDLTVGGLAGGGTWTAERYRITPTHDFSLVDRTQVRGTAARLKADLPPPGIELIVLTRQDTSKKGKSE